MYAFIQETNSVELDRFLLVSVTWMNSGQMLCSVSCDGYLWNMLCDGIITYRYVSSINW